LALGGVGQDITAGLGEMTGLHILAMSERDEKDSGGAE
jgi:hypothetical protein